MTSSRPDVVAQQLAQLDRVIEEARKFNPNLSPRVSRVGDTEAHTGVREELTQAHKVATSARAVVYRIAGPNSIYHRHCEEIMTSSAWIQHKALQLVGVVESLRADVEAGYMRSYAELLHGELFGDFLEMARHLLEEGYKDPSAVVAGAVLEGHLRQLCIKSSVDPTTDGTRPKKADAMNADLAKETAYNLLDQKSVTAWLDLRNKAAHGNYDQYTKDQVTLMVDGIRDFVARNPA